MDLILGLNYGHDSSAALVVDGKLVADVSEERFSRVKNDGSFPSKAIQYCLTEGGIRSTDLAKIVFATTRPQLDIGRYFDCDVEQITRPMALKGLRGWFRRARFDREQRKGLPSYLDRFEVSPKAQFAFEDHHLCHAASAYLSSGFPIDELSLVVTLDGVGDGTSASVWTFQGNRGTLLYRAGINGSLGMFYSNATEALGWRHGSDEWKVMGPAPYGSASGGLLQQYIPEYKKGRLHKGVEYGRFEKFNDHGAFHFYNSTASKMALLLGRVSREDFAAEVQAAVEAEALGIVKHWSAETGARQLACAGGFFLNVKFNQSVWYTGLFDQQWIYPNSGDAGLSAGAALYHAFNGMKAQAPRLSQNYLGPGYSDEEILSVLEGRGIDHEKPEKLTSVVADLLSQNLVIGWFQGRMEAGPRALGSRSILMSPLRSENKDLINEKVKFRESFRPFCPSILEEDLPKYLDRSWPDRFMTTSFRVLDEQRGSIPAVVHVDGTARPQSVSRDTNPLFWELLSEFKSRTGHGVLMNTSFNVKGEPIVMSPRDAIRTFFDTGLDALVLGNFLVRKPRAVRG